MNANSKGNVRNVGFSYGTLILLSQWFSIGLIIFSSELLIQYGMLGLIGFIGASVLSSFAFSFVASTIRRNFKECETMDEVILSKSSGVTAKILLLIIFLLNIGSLLIQAFAVNLMIDILFDAPLHISHLIFFSISYIYAISMGKKQFLKIEPILIFIVFTSVILIPGYFYIQKGITTVYNGIWLYHPYLLYWKNYESIFFVTTSIVLVFSFLMMDLVTWNRIFKIQSHRVRGAVTLAGLTLGTILLALLSMILISLSGKGYTNSSTVLFSLSTLLETPILVGLFIAFCLVVSLPIIGTGIHVVSDFYVRHVSKLQRSKRSLYFNAIILTLTLFFLSFVSSSQNIMDSIFIYGIICTSIIPIMSFVIFRNQSLHIFNIYNFLIGATCGIIVFLSQGFVPGLWTGFFISAIFPLGNYVKYLISE